MVSRSCVLTVATLLFASTAWAQHDHGAPAATGTPPLFSNLGSWSHPVTTASPQAQKYFDQGLRLYYGFNHAESIRAFREAARLDPKCAMAWWGIALAAGPNINLPMDEEQGKIALDAAGHAAALAKGVGGSDRAYIGALLTRYSARPDARRTALDSAYCDAMRKLAQRFPADADAAALFAESILDLNPWNQWDHDGRPNPGTLEAAATLEALLAKHPDHPGANHFYIHAVEASDHPERALAAAKRLETLVPGAGHLVHMPSHIYARTGQYHEALEQNRLAVAEEDSLHYDEPPTWYWPVRHALGAALLRLGQAKEAEAVYREDLRRHPDNGWSLVGLANALRAQGQAQAAAVVDERFRKAWSDADVKLAASEF